MLLRTKINARANFFAGLMDKPSWIERKPGGGFQIVAGLLERSNGWYSFGVSITAESCIDSEAVSEIVPACSLWCVAMLGRTREIEIFESAEQRTLLDTCDDKNEQGND